jgi:TrwC relaxase
MERFDREFQVRGGRRGRARRHTATSALTYARTRHATSRVGDPAPHDHIPVTNCCEMLAAKGGFKGGLDSAALRELLEAATMVGHLHAAAKARLLGYEIRRDGREAGAGSGPSRVCPRRL